MTSKKKKKETVRIMSPLYFMTTTKNLIKGHENQMIKNLRKGKHCVIKLILFSTFYSTYFRHSKELHT